MKKTALILFALCLAPSYSHAFREVGLSGSYKRSNLDENNFTETRSLTGSFSYYFAALSAIEFSYTKGLSTVQTETGLVGQQTTKTEFQLIGADFILSLGGRESAIRPYIKLGAVHVDSKILIQTTFVAEPDVIKPKSGIAPSAGLGVKLVLGKQFSIRLGIDGWTSPLSQDPVVYNYAGKVGVSWMF